MPQVEPEEPVRLPDAPPEGEGGVPHRDRQGRPCRPALFFLAFASGFAVLTIEIAGARLIAPVFGLSAVPWTAVIGVILAALAGGSHIGGRLADAGRVPLSAVLALGALAGALPVLGTSLPWAMRGAFGFAGGAVATALVLFAPAVACLGAVVPYLVKADTEALGSVGRRAGDMSAAATAGSIAGSFVTGFFLLPAMPLPVLLGLTAAFLLLLAAVAGRALGTPLPAATVIVAGAALTGMGALAATPAEDTLYRGQSLYAAVKVTERTWPDGRRVRELWQNGGSSSAEEVDSGDPAHRYAVVSGVLLEPVMERTARVLVLGGAALTLPVAIARWRPDVEIDVVEIDPLATELGRRFFAYGRAFYPQIRVIHEDGRVFLREDAGRYDIVVLDVFDHLLTVPWTMVTHEALRDAARALSPDGVLLANVLSPLDGDGAAFLRRFLATADGVFGAVEAFATRPRGDPRAVQNVLVLAAASRRLLPAGPWAPLHVRREGPPLRDAWAPVEALQARVFLEGIRWN